MAWGLWNKIKQGFKKAGNFIKNAAAFVNNKVIKPFKPIATTVANAIIPGAGRIIEEVSDGIDEVANGNFKGAAKRAMGIASGSGIRPYRKLNQ